MFLTILPLKKFPLFLSNFNESLIFFIDFQKIFKCQISLKSVHREPCCSMWTDGHDITVTFHNFVNAPKNDKAIPNLSALNKQVKKCRCIWFTYRTCLTQSKELTQKNTMSWSLYKLNPINVLLYLAAVIHKISL